MKQVSTFVLLLLMAVSSIAQSVTGSVRDIHQQPVPFAVVKLLRVADSTLTGGALANEAGQYVFTEVAAGVYRVQVSMVGMANTTSQPITVQGGQSLALEPIVLNATEKTLMDVTVRAQKSLVEQQVDKTVLNVAADATAQGKTAYELLQQAPGVAIDPNDNIRMAGKQGVNVFIDGKPTNLSAADLANLLRATPASNIDKVELITNPSARFDAQGGAGIINIKFRRDKNLGLNGNASVGYSQSDHHRASAALDLNYRAKRLNLFGNAAVSDNFQITNVLLNRKAGGSQFLQSGYDSDGTRSIVYKAGADYTLDHWNASPRQTVGFVVSGNSSGNRFGTYTTTRIIDSQMILDSTIANQSTTGTAATPARNNRINAALNYRYADTLGLELNLDADVTRFANTAPSAITSDYVDPAGQPLFRRQRRFDAATDITIVTLKSDFVKEWKNRHLKLETGLKHTDVTTDNDLLAFVGPDNTETREQPDVNRTNRFRYREIVSAGYASLNRSVGKWSMQGGIRVEHSTVTGRSVDLRQQIINAPDTTYLNLFPTAFVHYQATSNGQFALNYGRRIGRPNYQDMNPFVYQLDPYTSQRGNPYLRPTYTHNLAFSYTYKWASTIKLAYSHTNEYTTDVIRQEGLMAYQTVANVGRIDALTLSINAPYQFTKWWTAYAYAGATWNRFQGNLSATEPFDQRAFAFEGYMQHSFNLPKTWSAQVSGFWNAPTRQTVYRIGGLGALNLSLQKKVMQERGKITLGIDDILNTMRWKQSADFLTQQFNIDRKWESRRVTVRFTYRFGSKDIKAARERETGTDANRIKTKDNL